MMRKVVLVFVLCAFFATPAMADIVLKYDMDSAELSYKSLTKNLSVKDTAGSNLQVRKADNITLNVLDNAQVTGGASFDLLLDLTLFDEPGLNNWSGTGSLKFTDTVTGTNALEAAVQTYNIEKSNLGGTSYLLIQGALTDWGTNTSILVNRGDPWVFVGDSEISGEATEGTANQVTIFGPENYDIGDMFTIRFGMGTNDLDTLFGSDLLLTGGQVGGEIVPVPGAVLLGLLGLTVAGVKLRKYA